MNERLKKALHYVIKVAQDKGLNLGGVQLLKIIVFSDVAAFYYFGRTISDAKIVKAPRGPVPHGHKEALEELEAEGKIRVVKGRPDRFEKTRHESLMNPNISGFDVDELTIMSDLTVEFCGRYTAAALSNMTHNHSWEIAELGEEIPLVSYLGNRVEPTDEELAQIAAELKAEGLDGKIDIDEYIAANNPF